MNFSDAVLFLLLPARIHGADQGVKAVAKNVSNQIILSNVSVDPHLG